jgi:hypothetical protein
MENYLLRGLYGELPTSRFIWRITCLEVYMENYQLRGLYRELPV